MTDLSITFEHAEAIREADELMDTLPSRYSPDGLELFARKILQDHLDELQRDLDSTRQKLIQEQIENSELLNQQAEYDLLVSKLRAFTASIAPDNESPSEPPAHFDESETGGY